jgi:hypothetical protein
MTCALLPLAEAFPAASNTFVNLDTGCPVSAAQMLTATLLAPHNSGNQGYATVYLWDTATEKLAATFTNPEDTSVNSVAAEPLGAGAHPAVR